MLGDFLKSGGFDAYVMVSESVNSADMYYATGFLAHDPFACVCGENDFILISEMELGRAGKESRVADVRTTSGYGFMEKYRKSKDADTAYGEVLAEALSGKSKIAVPKSFPVYLADSLRREGFDVVPVKSPFHKLREVKTGEEVREIERTQRAAESAMAAALSALAASEDRRGELYLGGERLTSESLRARIEKTLLEQGCEASNTIVACGTASSDPHSTGEGVLRADEPVVIDMVPRHTKSRYYTDMTRTFARGDAPPELAEMYEAVRNAQETAFGMIRAGAVCGDVHNAVCDYFIERGYSVSRGDDRTPEGFIHSTGHGVGLDIHEGPSLGENDAVLEAGNVVTVEPGLYFRHIGGVRLEDVVVVTDRGCKNLTMFEKNLVAGA